MRLCGSARERNDHDVQDRASRSRLLPEPAARLYLAGKSGNPEVAEAMNPKVPDFGIHPATGAIPRVLWIATVRGYGKRGRVLLLSAADPHPRLAAISQSRLTATILLDSPCPGTHHQL